MVAKVVTLTIGLIIIFLNRNTLLGMAGYFLRPGSQELQFRLVKFDKSKIFSIVLLDFGIGSVVMAIFPHTSAVFEVELPKTIAEGMLLFSGVAFAEELIFRIAPWVLIFVFRAISHRNIKIERIAVILAICVNLIFGLLHATNYVNPDFWTYARTLSQVIGGLLYWYLLETDGIMAPVLAHFLFDISIWAGVTFL